MLTQDMSDSLVDVTDVFKKFWSEEDVQPEMIKILDCVCTS